MNRTVKIERLRAKTDTGSEYMLVVYQEFVSTASHDNSQAAIAGLKSIFTSTGLVVK
jgi:hypothetical protein